MKPPQITTSVRSVWRRGFTIIEAVVSTLIVGLMLAAALQTAASSVTTQAKLARRAQGRLLADALMTEIVQQNYEDPSGPVVFGPESGESAGLGRAQYDDVDDYDGYTETQLQQKDGTASPDCSGWKRIVTVRWVTQANLAQTSVTETRVKRIIVEAQFNSATAGTRTALRTKQQ
jgi:type II secretory pathway pseudopilin PulG